MAAWNLEAITSSVLERLTISTAANAFSLRMSKLQLTSSLNEYIEKLVSDGSISFCPVSFFQ